MFKKLRNRLTIIFVALTLIPLVLTGAIFAQRSFAQVTDDSIQKQRILDDRFGVSIQDTLNQHVNELTLVGEAFAVGNLSVQTQRDLVNKLITREEAFQDIWVVDSNGQERFHLSRNAAAVQDFRDRSNDPLFVQTVKKGKAWFSGVFVDILTSEPLMSMSIPFYDPRTGDLSYVIFAHFRFRVIWDLVATLQARNGEDLQVFLTNEYGLVVAHANPTIVLQNTVFVGPAKDGTAIGLGGENALMTTQKLLLGDQEFTIISEQPVSTAFKPAIDSEIGTAIITLLTLLVTIIVIAFVVRQIVQPIEQLSKTAQAIRDGNLDARTNMKRSDEIGILGRSFDDMTIRLQDLIRNLADRVNERVRDLTVASEVSRQVTIQLDTNKLLTDVTDLTAKSFNLSHVSIFLYEKEQQQLKLEKGTGAVGQQMIEMRQSFPITNQGLVPQAARKLEAVLSNDVLQDSHHLQNPLLPDTRSELAVPMLYQGELLGILDLQSENKDRFHEQDVRLMTTLAEQIAIAVHNVKLFEEVQAARTAAERANEVKSAFLASMSHELRTPLNAVINFTQFVIDGDVGPISEEQQGLLTEVVGSAKHLLDLINDVLDMSKIEAGSLNLFVEDNINLSGIVNRVVSTGKGLLRDKPVQIEVVSENDLPLIRGDQQRILQILLNIVSNACKFTDEGEITVNVHHDDNEVVISISDTGPGISLEDQGLVFEPFKQTQSGLRQGGGTGLGMPIAKNLAEAHGGRLWLESEPGKGATFHLALPIESKILVPIF